MQISTSVELISVVSLLHIMITGANSMLWLSKSKVIIEHVIVVSEQKGKES